MTSTPDEQPLAPTPTPTSIAFPPDTPEEFTIEDVLAAAKVPERTATICIRPDLQADYDEAITELSTLVDPTGKLLGDVEEASLGDDRAHRAQELNDRAEEIRRAMAAAMRSFRFRGLDSDEYSKFNKRWMPKGDDADLTDYQLRLIAETSLRPKITFEQAQALNAKLGPRAMTELSNTAWKVCNEGGLSVPKSLRLSVTPREQ